MKEITILGNGPSIKSYDLKRLPQPIWGCNAIHRDLEVDALFAVDPAIQHEIYRKGVASRIPVWFRNWSELPSLAYATCVAEDTNECPREDEELFVAQGTNDGKTYITWVSEDKSRYLNIIPEEFDTWGTGSTAVRVACEVETPDLVHLFGFDMEGKSVYHGTKNIPVYDHDEPFAEWKTQLEKTFEDFPSIDFIYYGKRTPEDWKRFSNVFEGWDSLYQRRSFVWSM